MDALVYKPVYGDRLEGKRKQTLGFCHLGASHFAFPSLFPDGSNGSNNLLYICVRTW